MSPNLRPPPSPITTVACPLLDQPPTPTVPVVLGLSFLATGQRNLTLSDYRHGLLGEKLTLPPKAQDRGLTGLGLDLISQSPRQRQGLLSQSAPGMGMCGEGAQTEHPILLENP